MNVQIEESWKQHLAPEFEKDYFIRLTEFVRSEYQTATIYPPGRFIFNAFNLCPFDKVKVVIIGQDPYHGPGQAHGLCFSVNDGVPFPPSLQNIFKEKYDKIFAVELGLSSDTFLADEISELENKTFLTNSDAHSLPKIAREYNKIQVEDISFKEIVKALKNEDGRKVIANYGLDPKLGKYHRTYCDDCETSIETKEPVTKCPNCGSAKVTFGVFDRIELIKDKKQTKSPANRPPYIYQIPLQFIPGVGGKTIEKLLNTFETEMNIIHKLSEDDIEAVVGKKIATNIINARDGKMQVHSGGGGNYGKIEVKNK